MEKETQKIIVLTKDGQIIPMTVRWSKRFTTPTNINRYVKPLIRCEFIAAITRGYVWTGHADWSYKFDLLPAWEAATSMQKNDNSLWD